MAINDADEFQRAAQLAQQLDPSDPRRAGLIEQLRAFDAQQTPQADAQASQDTPPLPAPGGARQGIIQRPGVPEEDVEGFRAAQQAQETPQQGQTLQDLADANFGFNTEEIGGQADAAGVVISGMLAEPAAGVAGLLTLIPGINRIPGLRPVDREETGLRRVSEKVESVRDALTQDDDSERGQEILQSIGESIAFIPETIDSVSAAGGMGNPYATAGIKSTIEGTLAVLPFGRQLTAAPKAAVQRTLESFRQRADVRRVREQYQALSDDLGVDLRSPSVKSDFASAVGGPDGGVPQARGVGLDDVQGTVRDAFTVESGRVNALYDRARGLEAWTQTGRVSDLGDDIVRTLQEGKFDLSDMPDATRTLRELQGLEAKGLPQQVPGAPPVARSPNLAGRASVNELETFRIRLNDRMRGVTDATELRVLGTMKRKFDRFEVSEFNNAMIEGDPRAVAAWAEARSARSSRQAMFDDDKVIMDLIRKEATPEQISQWARGATDARAPVQATQTLERLKTIVGETSPEWASIQNDFLHGVVAPLMRERPNYSGFLSNYDSMLRRNPSMMRTLGLDRGRTQQLVTLARAIDKVDPGKLFNLDLGQSIARLTVGHGIAKAAVRVSLVGGLIRAATRTGGSGQRLIFQQLAGRANPTGPLVSPGSVLEGAFISNFLNSEYGIGDEGPTDGPTQSQAQAQPQTLTPRTQVARPASSSVIRTLTGTTDDPTVEFTGSEGFRPRTYTNDVVKNPTIGHGLEIETIRDKNLHEVIGRNVEDIRDNGISPTESRRMVADLVAQNETALLKGRNKAFSRLRGDRRNAIRELAYWAGTRGALGFTKMWSALESDPPNWDTAAQEMMDSATVWGSRSENPNRPTTRAGLFNRSLVPDDRKWAWDRMNRIAQTMRKG